MTMTDQPSPAIRAALSPENEMVLNELARAEGIPPYAENIDAPPPAAPGPQTLDEDGRVECTICHTRVKASYLDGHMRKKHDIGRKREFKPRQRGNGKGHHAKPAAQVPAIVTPGTGKKKDDDEALTVDGIVATVVELRWPNTMPTRKALEMLEVRTVLERFLA